MLGIGGARQDLGMLAQSHFLVDLADGVFRNGPGLLATLIQNLLHIVGTFLKIAPTFPQGFQVLVHAGGQMPLAVNATPLGGGAFVVDRADFSRRAENFVQ